MKTAEDKNIIRSMFICERLSIKYEDVLNIYPYGSKIYGTAGKNSDDDYIIVHRSTLESGAFKNNAVSSDDRTIQGVCYSRSGFIDAINNYQISALECIFLPEEKIMQKKMEFSLKKIDKKELAKKIITTASSSWHFANLAYKDDNIQSSKKNVYHALRILDFGLQIKKHQKIVDYSSMNETKFLIDHEGIFKPKNLHDKFIEMCTQLRSDEK